MKLLHSTRLGSGPPLIILHGFLGMSDNWKTLGNRFAREGFEVHLVDQRNHGRSFHSEEFDYDHLSEDLTHYCSNYDLGGLAVIGHSMGGKTAMNWACHEPSLVDRLIVADIAPKYYPPHHQYIVDAMDAIQVDKLSSREEADRELAAFLGDRGIRQFLLKNLYWEDRDTLGWRCNLEVLKERLEEIGEPLESTDVFHGPTLFLRGERSEYIVDSDWPLIERHFPQARAGVVPGAGHWLHAENPDSFFQQSMEFLISS